VEREPVQPDRVEGDPVDGEPGEVVPVEGDAVEDFAVAVVPALWHPLRLRVDDDLRRSRLTVLLRLVLVLPQLVWAVIWANAMLGLVPFLWLATLFSGRLEEDAHRFVARWVRYNVHLNAYLYLIANPYPRFFGRPHEYPLDLEVADAGPQSRWSVGLRLLLAIPALIFASVVASILFAVAFLGWFAALALGRMPRGMRDLGAYCLRYQAQTYGYLFLLTPRYPTIGGGATGIEPPATRY
jgi:hypothetical protein